MRSSHLNHVQCFFAFAVVPAALQRTFEGRLLHVRISVQFVEHVALNL